MPGSAPHCARGDAARLPALRQPPRRPRAPRCARRRRAAREVRAPQGCGRQVRPAAAAASASGCGAAATRGQAHDRGSPNAGGAAAAACRRPRRGGPARAAAARQLAWRGSHARGRAPTAPRGRPCTQGARAPKAPRGRPCKQGARARCARARRGRSARASLPAARLPRRAARWGGRAAAVREAPPCPCPPACRPRPSPGAPRGAAGCLLRMQSHQVSPRRSRSGWRLAPVCADARESAGAGAQAGRAPGWPRFRPACITSRSSCCARQSSINAVLLRPGQRNGACRGQ